MKTLINKTYLSIFVVFCAVTVLVSSCKKDDPEPVVYGNAKVIVVNAVQGSTSQDFFQGTNKLNTTPISYGQSTSYLTLKAGYSNVSFKNANDAVTTTSRDIAVDNDVTFTAFYYANSTGAAQLATVRNDTQDVPPAGKAMVRFINLSPVFTNSIAVKTASDAAVINPIAYSAVTSYVAVDANAISDLYVYVVGSATSTKIPAASIVANNTYTIWIDAASTTVAQYHIIQN